MKKSQFGIVLVLGISLAPLHEAAADGCISEADYVLGDSSVSESKQSTSIAEETSSGAYAPEISTMLSRLWLRWLLCQQVSTGAATVASADTEVTVVSTTGTVIVVSSKLSDYFTIETPALREASQAKLTEWQQELQNNLGGIDKMLRAMADDGVVTSGEFFDLEKALMSYDGFLSDANKELAFYRLSIPEDERIRVYWKLFGIEQRHFSGDNRNKSVRRFFFNLTGKDVRVKVEWQDKVGRVFIYSIISVILILAL